MEDNTDISMQDGLGGRSEAGPEFQPVVEIDAEFLREIGSVDDSSAGMTTAAVGEKPVDEDQIGARFSEGGISVCAGSLAVVNSLSSRTVAALVRYLVGQRRPPAGVVTVLGHDMGRVGRGEILRLRRRIGVVGGDYGLIPDLTVAQNLALPCLVRKLGRRQARSRVERISEALRIAELLEERVSLLGSIERRVTLIARALAHDPELVILEAPLSGLDKQWSAVVVEQFKRLAVTGSAALFFHEYSGAFVAKSEAEK